VSAVIINSSDCEAYRYSDEATYRYYVKIINPKKKSDYIIRMWHGAKSAFKKNIQIWLLSQASFVGKTTEVCRLVEGAKALVYTVVNKLAIVLWLSV
jgi:hypothetical protein